MKTMKLVEVSGALLATEHEANPGAVGIPVLFLHANVADRRMWRGQWDALTTTHPVISYDRRGFGESRTLWSTPYSNVTDLWDVMDSLGYDRAVLVGCSMGGRIAIGAARQSERLGDRCAWGEWCANTTAWRFSQRIDGCDQFRCGSGRPG